MKLRFKINPYYLLAHSLERAGRGKPFPEWMRIVKRVQKLPLLPPANNSKMFIEINNDKNLDRLFNLSKKSFLTTLKTGAFKRLLRETERYRIWVENEWKQKGELAIRILKDITGLTFPRLTITVFITHPALPNGSNIPDRKIICWGHTEDWENYTVVYICHEILHILTHKHLKNEDIMHAIIELATDNELRIRLNQGGRYFKESGQEVGHRKLRDLEKQILPMWRKYLERALKAKNIMDFEKILIRQGIGKNQK